MPLCFRMLVTHQLLRQELGQSKTITSRNLTSSKLFNAPPRPIKSKWISMLQLHLKLGGTVSCRPVPSFRAVLI
eukprot:3953021-Amphidinium_carterae.1